MIDLSSIHCLLHPYLWA